MAAVALDGKGHPSRIKLTPLAAFTLEAIEAWSTSHLEADCVVRPDGLACFEGVSAARCVHAPVVVGGRKPSELPEFRWVNTTIMGNVKTGLIGTYHAFKFAKYAHRYLAVIAYRFNRRFQLKSLPQRLLVAAAAIGPRPERWLRLA
jgi:ISXO2-like transposase domain